jgi:hypothetical protein
MAEKIDKLALMQRLRAEGRWPQAEAFKNNAIAELKSKGAENPVEQAWAAMAEAYPPLPVAEGPAEPAAGAPEAMTTDAPPIPWSDLPTEGDFDEEVRWVHQQYILIVEETPRGRLIHWERATKKPPSTGACSLARWAATNWTAFYKDLLPKTMANAAVSPEEEALVREDKRSVAEISGLLSKMLDGMDEELRADVPKVLQQRVRDMLSHWVQQFGVSLAADARARLDSAIVGLLQDSLRAFAPSSGGE